MRTAAGTSSGKNLQRFSFYIIGKCFAFSYDVKKPSGQDRTAAERNYVAESNPPQAENPAKQDSFLKKGDRYV